MTHQMRGLVSQRRLRGGLGIALLATFVLALPLAAQQQQEPECRCVNAKGEKIENCRCLRLPDLSGLQVFSEGGLFARRAQIGVWIDYDQGGEVDDQGARVTRVQEEGPADEAGLREGDVVTRVDGHSLFDALEDADAEAALSPERSLPVQRFARLVGDLEPGQPVELEVLRDGEPRTLTVTPTKAKGLTVLSAPRLELLGREGVGLRLDLEGVRGNLDSLRTRLRALPEWTGKGAGVFRFEGPEGRKELRVFGDSLRRLGDWQGFSGLRADPCLELHREGEGRVWVLGGGNCVAGVEFLELNPDLGEYFGTDRGVLVSDVAESSTLGLRPGDVVLAIDGREVQDVDQARRILGSYEPGEELRIRILRKGAEQEVLGQRQ